MRDEIMSKYSEYLPYLFNYGYFYTEDECADYEKGYVDFANDIYKFYGQGMSGTLTCRSIDFALWLKRNIAVVSK